jgi:hypothetical protein
MITFKANARLTSMAAALGMVLSVTAAAGVAQAAPTTLHEQQVVYVNAPPAKVWDTVKSFNDLTWVPLVKSSSATDGNKRGSVRRLDMGGAFLTEKLLSYDANGHNYTYQIENSEANQKVAPIRDVTSTIAVQPAIGGGSNVTWLATFRRLDASDTPAAGQDDATAKQAMGGVISTGLGGLKKKLEAN